MKVTLKNLGKLREATIDLSKDLILLTGPNNTSKTYVAHAIYGLHQSMLPIGLDAVKDLLGRELPEWKYSEDLWFKVDVNEFFERHFASVLQYIASRYTRQLPDVFAAREDSFGEAEVRMDVGAPNYSAAATASHVREGNGIFEGRFVRNESLGKAEWVFERPVTLPPDMSTPQSPRLRELKDSELTLGVYSYVISWALWIAFRVPVYSYILTAERAAIQLFSRELSANRTELVDSLLQFTNRSAVSSEAGEGISGLLGRRAQRYPMAIRDGLRIANDLSAYSKKTSSWSGMADELERQMLGGSFHVEEGGEMLFLPGSSKTGLGLHLTSSSVKSLAGLTFFLRHIASGGYFLIIDEPELNLHPDNQRRVARLLGRLARSGIKVLISTHSDYVIREINNLIMLSADEKGEVRQRLGYDEAEVLKPSQVAAYLFDAEKARPIDVQPTGIEVETIDREINSLNAVSQDIYFSLFGKMGT